MERLWTIAHQHFRQETPKAAVWVSAQKSLLRQSRLRQIMRNVRRLFPHHHLPESVRKAVAYLYHNRHRMYYKEYRNAGYPIGSGSVESDCKLVVQTRLKQAGAQGAPRWKRTDAQTVLALRSMLLSDNWAHATQIMGLT